MRLAQVFGGVKNLGDFFVDDLGRVLAELARAGHFAAEEGMVFARVIGDRPEPLAHAPVRDHAAGEPRGFASDRFRRRR